MLRHGSLLHDIIERSKKTASAKRHGSKAGGSPLKTNQVGELECERPAGSSNTQLHVGNAVCIEYNTAHWEISYG